MPFKKRRNRRKRPRRRPINVLASVLTTFGLCCGVASIFAAMAGDFVRASGLIIIAIIFDMLDGSVAKLTNSVSEFGKQFDSLCDLASFGVAPAALIYSVFLAESGGEPTAVMVRAGSIMAVTFAVCGALRLARFTLYQTEKRDYFVGLPIPAAGGAVASLYLFIHYFEMEVAYWLIGIGGVGLALLMVSTVPYPKDRIKAVILMPRNAFPLLLVSGIIIAFFVGAADQSPAVILFPLVALYIGVGVAEEIKGRWRRRYFRGAPVELDPGLFGGPDEGVEAEPGDGRVASTSPGGVPASQGDQEEGAPR